VGWGVAALALGLELPPLQLASSKTSIELMSDRMKKDRAKCVVVMVMVLLAYGLLGLNFLIVAG
jgi:uncharacterized membrane protein